MNFQHKFPEWKNKGKEPSETLKTTGFVPKYKPPASFFNWFWSKVMSAITEIQTNIVPIKGQYKGSDIEIEHQTASGNEWFRNPVFAKLGFKPSLIIIQDNNGNHFFVTEMSNSVEQKGVITNNFDKVSLAWSFAKFDDNGVYLYYIQNPDSVNSPTKKNIAAEDDRTYFYTIYR